MLYIYITQAATRKKMDNAKKAVAAALSIYAETSGMSLKEVGRHFAEDALCRENIMALTFLMSNASSYAAGLKVAA